MRSSSQTRSRRLNSRQAGRSCLKYTTQAMRNRARRPCELARGHGRSSHVDLGHGSRRARGTWRRPVCEDNVLSQAPHTNRQEP